jgi:septum formation protein
MSSLPLILASASPRRRNLLLKHGYNFRVTPAEVTEIMAPHLSPGEITLFNARAKAHVIARQEPSALVLGVDTVVAFDGEVLGKPANMDAAFAMVKRLNGKSHDVYSGVWLRHGQSGRERGFIEVTRVHFRKLNDAQLHAYLARIGPLDKAGAYAAQEDRGELIDSIEGSFTNVIGLPMEALAMELEEFSKATA